MKKKSLAVLMAALMASPAWGQFVGFPRTSYWQEMWQSTPSEVEIEAVSRLRDFVVDGTLVLSLQQYIELVLTNHGDVQVAKLNVYSQENNIQAALSPFDPRFSSTFTAQRSAQAVVNRLDGSDNVLSSLSQSGRADFNKTFDTGTAFTAGYSTNRLTTNSTNNNLNPQLTQAFNFSVTQPLLRNRGRSIQRIPYFIAQIQRDRTEETSRLQIMNLIATAENIYWTAVQRRESLIVQERNVGLSQALLDRNHRELDLGAISPLDIYQPEQSLANAQIGATQARYALEQAEDAVRRQIGADLDPDFRNMPMNLTEVVAPPENPPTFDEEETVALAMRLRPDLNVQRRQLDIDDLQIRRLTNQLRPDLSLRASYSSNGVGGNTILYDENRNPTGEFIPGGLFDAWRQLFGLDNPTYSVALTLDLPLRNRQGAANLANQTIAKKQDLYDLRSTEQDIRLDVVQAIAGVEQAKASVEQALEARRFSQLRLDAEQQKYDLGVSETFFVLQAQQDLVQAENAVVNQSINYRLAVTNLYRVTGDLLNQRNVQLQYN